MRVDAPGQPAGQTRDSETPIGVLNEDLLIKEAKRRHRRRLAVLGGGALAVAWLISTAVALLSPTSSTPHRPPPPAHHPPPATSAPTTPTVPVSDPTCTSSQLAIDYTGPQGAAGQWLSSFAIADTSAQPCALRSGVTVEFFDAQGNDRIASTQIPADVALSPDATLPPPGQRAPPKEQLGVLMLGWPTIPNAVTQLTGGVGVQCPEPLFAPQAARITFVGLAPITVDSAPIPPNETICGSSVRIEFVDPEAS